MRLFAALTPPPFVLDHLATALDAVIARQPIRPADEDAWAEGMPTDVGRAGGRGSQRAWREESRADERQTGRGRMGAGRAARGWAGDGRADGQRGATPRGERAGAGRRGASHHRAEQRDPLLPRATWHITLAFFGEVPDGHVPELSGGLAEIVSQFPPFELELAGAGSFSSRQAWIGVGGDVAALKRLMAAAERLWPGPAGGDWADGADAPDSGGSTAIAASHPAHRPHLTISRALARTDLRDQLHALAVYRGPTWTVTSAQLLESTLRQGPGGHSLYTPVAEVPLGG